MRMQHSTGYNNMIKSYVCPCRVYTEVHTLIQYKRAYCRCACVLSGAVDGMIGVLRTAYDDSIVRLCVCVYASGRTRV